MFYQPPANFLYSAYLIQVAFSSVDGSRKEGKATGFVVSTKENMPVVITNRHVIDLDYRQKDARYKDYSLQQLRIKGRRTDDSVYTFDLNPKTEILYDSHYENDVVAIIPRVLEAEPEQFAKGIHWHFGIEHLATEDLFQNLLYAYDDVAFSGFPAQYDRLADRPIMRSGKIASDPKFDYSWSDQFEGSCVAYEAFSSEGASGSPVFAPPRGLANIPNSRNGYLVGINAGHVPDHQMFGTHSGISYFYKSTVILNILKNNNLI